MQPKITFLGTGGDPFVVGKQKRASGGIVFCADNIQILLDPGPGALIKAKEYKINLRETTAVCVSHGHLNHSNDLNAVISAMTYNGLDAQGVIVGSSSAINGFSDEDKNIVISPSLSSFFSKCVEKAIVLKAGQRLGIESIEIEALRTSHSDPTAIGFKFFTPEYVLTYSSDTAYFSGISEQYKKSDILILNCVYPAEMKPKENLSEQDAEKIIAKAKPKLCILTHFGNRMIEQDPLYIAREIQKKTGVQVIAAVDGLEIHPLSYSAKMNQKTLNLYNKK